MAECERSFRVGPFVGFVSFFICTVKRELEYPQDHAYNHVDMMKRQIEFEVEEKNNDVTSAKWTTVIAGTYGKKNETFQVSRYLTYVSYFDVSFTYTDTLEWIIHSRR